LAQDWQWRTRKSHLASVAPRLFNQSRFVEELITIENFLLVPWAAAGPKTEPQALAPSNGAARLRTVRASGPFGKEWLDHFVKNVGSLFAPVLPGEELVPGLKTRARGPQG